MAMRAALLAAVIVLATPVSAAAADVQVGSNGDTFTPRATTIVAGDSVTWTMASGGHNVDGGTAFNTGPVKQPAGSTFTHTFLTAGSFPYLCDFHGGMTGTVTVTRPAPPPPPPGPPPVGQPPPVDPVTGVPIPADPGADPAPPGAAPPAVRRRSPCDRWYFGRHWCLVALRYRARK